MRLLTLALFIAASAIPSLDASPSNHLELSKSFSLDFPSQLRAQLNFLPSLGGFWLEGRDHGKPISIWVQRTEPEIVANEYSVKRLWSDGMEQTQALGESSEDLGCKSSEKYVFRCDRRARGRSGRYAAEILVWNSVHDLVVIRVMSGESFEAAQTVAGQIHYRAIAKLAGGK
ncbi:MAG: hypothetical protein ACXWP5_10610 [Bdellovibrionota bacterium]